MPTRQVLFIQGGGDNAHAADAPLAESLRQALGTGCQLHYPRMVGEGEPDLARWKQQVAAELAGLRGPLVLVGHSLGGSALLRLLCEDEVTADIASLHVLAAPAFDGRQWAYDDLKLPDDAADRLAVVPQLFLYHCRDDETVPFAHLALHAAQLPQAMVRALAHGGHAFEGQLGAVVVDIVAAGASPRG